MKTFTHVMVCNTSLKERGLDGIKKKSFISCQSPVLVQEQFLNSLKALKNLFCILVPTDLWESSLSLE